MRNLDYDWNRFDASEYHAHNYTTLRDDDAEIIAAVRDWFATVLDKRGPRDTQLHGLDVGTGPNIYPALTMLPYCKKIDMWEHSLANVAWLRRQLVDPIDSWAPFADAATGYPWSQARSMLQRNASVWPGSIFDLPKRQWDIGTMFFVAESITSYYAECRYATHKFLNALKPGAPFAAAFMECSDGYTAGSRYPALYMSVNDVSSIFLGASADDVVLFKVSPSPEPFRSGYTGYIVATGVKGGALE